MARSRRSGRPVTVLFCDLDGLKRVNDVFGHTAGDRLITAVAERLLHAVRDEDVAAMIAEGHVLLEDFPGTGKTALARALSQSIKGTGSRIQFTPDLLPGDVTGISVYDQKSGKFEFHAGPVFANVVLVAIGRVPYTDGLGLNALGINMSPRGQVETDAHWRTNIPGIYGAGDIIGPPWLAHVASYEAVHVVEGMFTKHTPKKVGTFPGCTYCQPQVASTGLTEKQAIEKGYDVRVGTFQFFAARGELDKLHGVHLISGMPAEVFIDTGARSLFQYIIQPLQDSFRRAFRES